jgi:WD40 repeat protein
MTVADDATILVSTGPDRPIRLGEALRYSHGRDNTVHVWDWSKSDESRPLKGVHGCSMDVSPGGEWIVTYDARVIDAASGAARQLEAFGRHISGMKFSPDGRTLLVIIREDFGPAAVGTARVLDFPSGKKRFDIAGQSPHIFACAFTADGSQFFLMDKDRFVRRWDAATGEELGRYEPAMANSISAIAVSADAKQVAAAGSRGETYLWDLAGGKLLHKSEAQLRYGPRMHSLAFSPDGSLLAGGASSSLVLWQTDGGTVARQFRYDARGAVHLRFSKDGKRLTSVHEFYGTRKNAGEELTAYPEVREWNVESGEELKSSR